MRGQTRFKVNKYQFPRVERTILEFDLKPLDLESYVDQYLIGQKEAKSVVCTKICTYFHKIKQICLQKFSEDGEGFIKPNILILGPTGVGKTYLMKLISKKIGIPFVKADATKFSETGYVGGDIEDLIRELYWEAEEDLERARFGMIFLDEIDKIASSGEVTGIDVSRTGVQRGLLKPLEDTKVEIKLSSDSFQLGGEGKESQNKIYLHTKYVLFIGSGAFQGLEEIIKKRLNKTKLGFLAEVEEKENKKINYLKFVSPEDLVKYGFEREFVGRFPVIAVFDPLGEEELYEILANPNSNIILNKKRDFKAYGIDLVFTEDALKEVSKRAYKEGTGARGLVRILERALMPFERTLPSSEISCLAVTSELLKDPEGYLSALLLNPSSEKWQNLYLQGKEEERKRFLKFYEKKISFKEEITEEDLPLIFEIYKNLDCEVKEAIEKYKHMTKQITYYKRVFERKKGIKITFTRDAISYIIMESLMHGRGIYSTCESLMNKISYALILLKPKMDKPIQITSLTFKQPEKFLNQLYKEIKDHVS